MKEVEGVNMEFICSRKRPQETVTGPYRAWSRPEVDLGSPQGLRAPLRHSWSHRDQEVLVKVYFG